MCVYNRVDWLQARGIPGERLYQADLCVSIWFSKELEITYKVRCACRRVCTTASVCIAGVRMTTGLHSHCTVETCSKPTVKTTPR